MQTGNEEIVRTVPHLSNAYIEPEPADCIGSLAEMPLFLEDSGFDDNNTEMTGEEVAMSHLYGDKTDHKESAELREGQDALQERSKTPSCIYEDTTEKSSGPTSGIYVCGIPTNPGISSRLYGNSKEMKNSAESDVYHGETISGLTAKQNADFKKEKDIPGTDGVDEKPLGNRCAVVKKGMENPAYGIGALGAASQGTSETEQENHYENMDDLRTDLKDEDTNSIPIRERQSSVNDVPQDAMDGGGGWTVIQRRLDGSVPFNRTLADYKRGFGNKTGEHWLGNDYLHLLTYQKNYSLRVDWISRGINYPSTCSHGYFRVSDENNNFRLDLGPTEGKGIICDQLISIHSGCPFSTVDKNNNGINKQSKAPSCVKQYGGGWWYMYDMYGSCGHMTGFNQQWNFCSFKSCRKFKVIAETNEEPAAGELHEMKPGGRTVTQIGDRDTASFRSLPVALNSIELPYCDMSSDDDDDSLSFYAAAADLTFYGNAEDVTCRNDTRSNSSIPFYEGPVTGTYMNIGNTPGTSPSSLHRTLTTTTMYELPTASQLVENQICYSAPELPALKYWQCEGIVRRNPLSQRPSSLPLLPNSQCTTQHQLIGGKRRSHIREFDPKVLDPWTKMAASRRVFVGVGMTKGTSCWK
uniref:Fibrinogen C-terminal domain-containing protein n=1 Tax=Branchiostoma floridae TaxID=7739 RepID=C3YQL8_BRAFL|eukprot:XP_002601362.1 hypothetical protein BRAFLDRAFT_82714 [Branchiostoma floridae]